MNFYSSHLTLYEGPLTDLPGRWGAKNLLESSFWCGAWVLMLRCASDCGMSHLRLWWLIRGWGSCGVGGCILSYLEYRDTCATVQMGRCVGYFCLQVCSSTWLLPRCRIRQILSEFFLFFLQLFYLFYLSQNCVGNSMASFTSSTSKKLAKSTGTPVGQNQIRIISHLILKLHFCWRKVNSVPVFTCEVCVAWQQSTLESWLFRVIVQQLGKLEPIIVVEILQVSPVGVGSYELSNEKNNSGHAAGGFLVVAMFIAESNNKKGIQISSKYFRELTRLACIWWI